jgi:hypothetical protein
MPAVSPDDVSAVAVGQAVRELLRAGLLAPERDYPASGWVSIDCIPLIAQHLGFRKKTVRALRAELREVRRQREEEHVASAVIAGYQYGRVPLDAAAFILRGQGKSSG